jgi:predicted 3-demethylubiquinone-9 3-methyltransferase (glyoxalase superfamily)
MSKVSPCLWFDGQAEEAAKFYVSLLPDSRIEKIQKNTVDSPAGKAGSVLVVEFTLAGQRFMALNGGKPFDFTHAISFKIDCADQAEVDRLWDALSANGGQVERCGWLKDRYGVSWADRADRPCAVSGRFGRRRRATGNAGDDADGQARYRRAEAGL